METKIEDIKKVAEILKNAKIERNGFILYPTVNGFDMYKISEVELNLFLRARGGQLVSTDSK